MSVSLESPQQSTTTNPFSYLVNTISSYDGNVMLAAVISLLLVILFVLLLHVYAKWFLAQARQGNTGSSTSTSSSSMSTVSHHRRFHHFHAFTFETTTSFFSFPSKGLDSSVISSIPLFVYSVEEYKHGLECVVCLSSFEENDVGRSLPKCGHGFHVECIDMWLQSHSNCPICRAPVMLISNHHHDKVSVVSSSDSEVISSLESVGDSRLENLITDHLPHSNNRAAVNDDNQSSSSSSSSLTLSASSLGCSLKRMLSRNRSERKVFPSSNAIDQLEV